jgi:hypothetical protein
MRWGEGTMNNSGWFWVQKPDVAELKQKKDIKGLIRMLRHKDLEIQWEAATALAELGSSHIDLLIHALRSRNLHVRIGIIGALGTIGDPKAVQPLIRCLQDSHSEIRWESALALGSIGDPSVIEPLRQALRDPDKYVRYGAFQSLDGMGWKPQSADDKAFFLFAGMMWQDLQALGKGALPALRFAANDLDGAIRLRATDMLGETGDAAAIPTLMQALADEDEEVRWKAIISAPKCGIPMKFIPRALAKRPRKRKNPYIAGFLNFVLPGMGYFYLGLWWGILLFQVDLTLTLWMYSYQGQQLSFGVLLPVYFVLAFHAWYIGKNLPDFS